jgi:hypothetical protein
VRLALQNGGACEIITSAAHAKEILSGATVIPVRIVLVFDRDGRRLSPSDLEEVSDASADRPIT